MVGCGERYENLLGDVVICGNRIYDSQGLHQCLCDKCRNKEVQKGDKQ